MLLVLALLWGGFILYWLRSHAQAGFGDSVGSFRRDLHVLERTAPATMRPANRLRGPRPAQSSLPARRAAASPLTARRPGPHPSARQAQARIPVGGPQARRRQAAKRRRDVLFLLAVVVAATLVMAVATRSHPLIAAQVAADAALGAYVALLVRLRNLAAEREIKLSYLSRARTSNQSRRRYEEVETGYGDLALRRTAT